MLIFHRFILLYTTFLAFCVLYALQPLLPVLSHSFSVSAEQATLVISITLLPLALAPILYGFILESISAVRILKVSVLLLALSEGMAYWVTDFSMLLGLRFLQGLLLPAILTAVMTYISSTSNVHTVRKHLGYYIAATILGGFLGRLMSGVIATYMDWRWHFLLLTAALLSAWGLLFLLHKDSRLHWSQPSWYRLHQVFAQPFYLKLYGIIFLVFFCFASVLNILPFRLQSLSNNLSSLSISLVYSGYLIGIVLALSSFHLSRYLGGIVPSVRWGLAAYSLAIALLLWGQLWTIYATLFLFCAGMFWTHSLLSGWLNQHINAHRGMANGLYVASYYAGGVCGSYFPTLIYIRWGWSHYVLSLLLLSATAVGISVYLRDNE